MIRKLKALGLALVAVLAMSAMAASTSQALEFTTVTGNSPTVTANQIGVHTFVLNGRTLTCATAKFVGTAPAKSKFFTATPEYATCHTIVFGSTWPVTVTHNGCNFKFNNTPEKDLDVECPVGNAIEIHIYESSAAHASGTSVCTYHVGAQTITFTPPNHELVYHNVGAGHTSSIEATVKNATVTVTRTGGTALLCGAEHQTATYNGNVESTAAVGVAHEGFHLK